MTKGKRLNGDYRLLCEKVVNESWSQVEKYTDLISDTLEKEVLNSEDIDIIKMAARAFVQKAILERADSVSLFGVDLYDVSPCGTRLKKDCPCSRDKCLLAADQN